MEQPRGAQAPDRRRPEPPSVPRQDRPLRSALDRAELSRSDLPAEFTPGTVRILPISVLRRLRDPRNTILDADDQRAFDQALDQVMDQTARRLSTQVDRADWDRVAREARMPRGGPWQGHGKDGGASGVDDRASRRIAKRVERQLRVAQELAPDLDWSFAGALTEPDAPPAAEAGATTGPDAPADTGSPGPAQPPAAEVGGGSISDLEEQVTDQVELVQAMSEVAEISRRTYALEQRRDLESTRGLFFGFLVSVAVIVAGWAPVVTAPTWTARWWMLGLTVATCLVAGLVYVLVSRRQGPPAD